LMQTCYVQIEEIKKKVELSQEDKDKIFNLSAEADRWNVFQMGMKIKNQGLVI